MRVKAKHWVKTDTGWHPAGDTFEVETVDGLDGMVEIVEGAGTGAEGKQDEKPVAKKRTRRQTEE